jgi:hypothetical protein
MKALCGQDADPLARNLFDVKEMLLREKRSSGKATCNKSFFGLGTFQLFLVSNEM